MFPQPAVAAPIPEGRGLWRITLHNRVFDQSMHQPSDTGIGELVEARSRRLDQSWNQPAQFTFTIDGHSQGAALIQELRQDIIVWRWDVTQGKDIPFFRGPIAQSEDQINENGHVVTVTCHDYLAMYGRRFLTSTLTVTQQDQDLLVNSLVQMGARSLTNSAGASLYPGITLPFNGATKVNPDGSARTSLSNTLGAPLRDRTYFGQQFLDQAIDNLATVISGFDYDVLPRSDLNGYDTFRIFFPVQGVTRSDFALVYGSNVAEITRTVNSSDFANYERVLGNNGVEDGSLPQVYSEAQTSDATAGQVGSVGVWMSGENASDVAIQSTLDSKAQGDLAQASLLVPSYTLQLTPGWYVPGTPNMGDVVPFVINSGRLAINTTIRIVGISYSIGDDGQEDVALTVGRPTVSFTELFTRADRDVDAIARR
jgi:hypothetical protein